MSALSLLLLPALAYQTLSILASLNHLRRRYSRRAPVSFTPAVSVLKPLRGLDPNTYAAFISQASQRYRRFEILFGAAAEDDRAIPDVRRLRQQFPHVPIRMLVGSEPLANGKIGVLANLARHAKHPVWVVNDSDIKVGSDYLESVVAPLADPSVGVVTCLYRAKGHTVPAVWESLGVATDFMPSTLVAQLIGVRDFGLGSTLAFRAADFEHAGGFEAIGSYLADDYQLAKRITGLGKRALLSTYTVETSFAEASWGGAWMHQIRWARTIRASKGGGYAGLPLTHAGLWILIGLCAGWKTVAFSLLGLRLAAAFVSAGLVLGSSQAAGLFWLSPVWDLYSFAVWLTSYAGRQVRWRDRVLEIGKQGRILGKDEPVR